jgi:hypothetical protein
MTAPRSVEEWRSLLGRKVSVRFRAHDDPEYPFSEAIGVVQSVADTGDGARLRMINRKGRSVEIALDDVLAAKVFPSSNPSRST